MKKTIFTFILIAVALTSFAQNPSDPISRTTSFFDDDLQKYVKNEDHFYEYDHKGRILRDYAMVPDSRAKNGSFLSYEWIFRYDNHDRESYVLFRQYNHDLDLQQEPLSFYQSEEKIHYRNNELLYYEYTYGEHFPDKIEYGQGSKVDYTLEGDCRVKREFSHMVIEGSDNNPVWKPWNITYYERNENCDITSLIRENYSSEGEIFSTYRTDYEYSNGQETKSSRYNRNQQGEWELASTIEKVYGQIKGESIIIKETEKESRNGNLVLTSEKDYEYETSLETAELKRINEIRVNNGETEYFLKEYYILQLENAEGYQEFTRLEESAPWLLLEEEKEIYESGKLIQVYDYTYSQAQNRPEEYYLREVTTDFIYDENFVTSKRTYYYTENVYADVMELFEIEYEERFTPRCDGKVKEYVLEYYKYQDPCNPSNVQLPSPFKYDYFYGSFDPCDEKDLGFELKVYPNPTSDWITVESELLTDYGVQIELVNSDGRNVIGTIERRGKSIRLNVSDLITGLYYLTIYDNDHRYSQPVFVQR